MLWKERTACLLLLFSSLLVTATAFIIQKDDRINRLRMADITVQEEQQASIGSTTVSKDNYDIVQVDLENGRDYPIYIGTGYSNEEGM